MSKKLATTGIAAAALAACVWAVAATAATSPGTRIVFHGFHTIKTMGANGANPRTLLTEKGTGATAFHFTDVAASKNGKRIAAVKGRLNSGGPGTAQVDRIVIMRGDGSNARLQFEAFIDRGVNSIAITADGRFIAFPMGGDLHTAAFGGKTMKSIVDGRVKNPAFSQDGSQLVFEMNTTGNQDVWIADRDGSNLKQLTTGEADETDPHFSPDGKFIVYGSDANGGQVMLMRVNGTGQKLVTKSGAGELTAPDYSPGGGSIVFVGKRDGKFRFFTVRASGINKKLVNANVGGKNPSWVRRP